VFAVDHLLFLLACAMVLALSAQTWRQTVLPILAFVCAAAIAAFGQSFMPPVSGVEWVVGGGLLLAAAALWQQRAATLRVRIGPAALAGLVSSVGLAHGIAYGEAVIGAEATPMLSYLAGLSLVQAATMGATVWLTRRLATMHSRHLSGVVRALASLAAMAGVWVLGAAAVA
jgi:urease accessory protein